MSNNRTTLEICIAVKEAAPDLSDHELRLAVEALGSILHFYRKELTDLIQKIRETEDVPQFVKMKSEFAWGTVERMFDAIKKPPADWLGPDNIPGSHAQQEKLAWAKSVYKAATGEDL